MDSTTISDAGVEMIRRGMPILACDGKRPIGDAWQHETLDERTFVERLRTAREPAIGLKLGPTSGYLDIETDSAAEEAAFAALFEGCDPPVTATYQSVRGKHRLFAWDDRLSATGKAVVYYKAADSQVGIRIGAGDKGAQSIIPPSPGREWLVRLDETKVSPLPDLVIDRILSRTTRQAPPANTPPCAAGHAIQNGQRNATLASLAGSLRQKGLSQDSIAAALAVESEERCQPPLSKAEVDGIAASISQYPTGQFVGTPRSKRKFLPWRPFPVDALPQTLRDFVVAGASSIGCDATYLILPCLSVCAAAIGTSRRLALKKDWTEPAIVWSAIIGESGTAKTPAFNLAMEPMRKRQRLAIERYRDEMKVYGREMKLYRKDLNKFERAKADFGDPPEEPASPTRRRFLVSDITVEAIAPLLEDNHRGLLLAADELNGWVGSFDKYRGKNSRASADASSWLSMFNAGSIIVDRKSADVPISVDQAAVCVTGGIQPAILRKSLGTEHHENGLAARLLMRCPPHRPKRWTDAEIDPEVLGWYDIALDELFALEPAVGPDGERQPVLLGLTLEAKRLWVDHVDRHNEEGATLAGDLRRAWSKLEAYGARLALVFHCLLQAESVEGIASDVDQQTMAAALEVLEWFKYETRRVYTILAEDDGERRQREVLEWIESRGSSVTVRELTQGRRDFEDAETAEQFLQGLVGDGLGFWEHVSTTVRGGRPTRRFMVMHPSASVVYETGVSGGNEEVS